MKKKALTTEQQTILEQVKHIASALGATLAPFTEVVVHDLRSPQHAILAIHNNLSGRHVGDPATELGLARIADDEYPQVLANYANQFADGRRAKSTSIGIKDSEGHYFAALCLNVDVTVFRGLATMIEQFSATSGDSGGKESLDPGNADAIRDRIDRFAMTLATTPRALRTDQRRDLVQTLKGEGFLELKRSMDTVAQHLGVSRATVYNDVK
ncbi:MAG: PAS domain-containing protein [Proteobacteria bacterium]|nr:PAS domain-containing protein [Pseudomonadota bacterium]